MRKIEINGKNYELRITVGTVMKFFKQYDVSEVNNWTQAQLYEYSARLVFIMVKPRFIFKPFITFKRFLNNVTVEELKESSELIQTIVFGADSEDKESGNDQ